MAGPGRALWAGNFMPAKLALFTQAVVWVCFQPLLHQTVFSVDSGSLARQLVPQWLKLNLLPSLSMWPPC